MGRHREFDRDAALDKALRMFWSNGYYGSSLKELVGAMGIGTQSLYNTFNSKRALYLEALHRYCGLLQRDLYARLCGQPSPLAACVGLLMSTADETDEARARGCFAVNSASEFGCRDPAVVSVLATATAACTAVIEHALHDARDRGEIAPDVDPRMLGRFVWTTLSNLRMHARAGASSAQLREIASMSVIGLGDGLRQSRARSLRLVS